MSEAPQLILEVEGQSWPLLHGDVIGRLSKIGGGALLPYGMLSRQHLRVTRERGHWCITLLPDARNLTLLDGVPITPGTAQRLGPVNNLTVGTFNMRLLIAGEKAGEPLPDQCPVGLVVLDEFLALRFCSEFAQTLFPKTLSIGLDFAGLFQAEAGHRLRQSLMVLTGQQPSDEMALQLAQGGAWLSVRFRRTETGFFHGMLRDGSGDHLLRETVKIAEHRLAACAESFQAVLVSSAFRAGDLPAALPMLAQQASILLEQVRVSLWVRQPDGRLCCNARSDAADAPAIGRMVEAAVLKRVTGEINITVMKQMKSLGVLSKDTREAFFETMESATVILERETPQGWTSSQRKLARLSAALLQQALINAERSTIVQALQAREAALAADLAEAGRYIERLLPEPVPTGPVRVEWLYLPCGDLGGDVFGYQWLDENRFAIYILDVVGHGSGASLLAVSVINRIRMGFVGNEAWVANPSDWLVLLNKSFPMEQHGNLTWTMWCGIFDHASRELSYSSGGHPPALLVSGGKTQELTTEGLVLGAMPDVVYETKRAKVPAGAKLFLCTDGVYEFPHSNGREGTFSEYANAAAESWPMARGDCAFLHKRAAALCAENRFPDDFTIVRVQFAG